MNQEDTVQVATRREIEHLYDITQNLQDSVCHARVMLLTRLDEVFRVIPKTDIPTEVEEKGGLVGSIQQKIDHTAKQVEDITNAIQRL